MGQELRRRFHFGTNLYKDTGKYGRGIYATRDIKTGELIEASPVLVHVKMNGISEKD